MRKSEREANRLSDRIHSCEKKSRIPLPQKPLNKRERDRRVRAVFTMYAEQGTNRLKLKREVGTWPKPF